MKSNNLLEQYTQEQLDVYWNMLSATALPTGEYEGHAWSNITSLGMMNWFWKGKIFEGNKVRNRILGLELFEGKVKLANNEIMIHYPMLGLWDHLRQINEKILLGRMFFHDGIINFTLTKKL